MAPGVFVPCLELFPAFALKDNRHGGVLVLVFSHGLFARAQNGHTLLDCAQPVWDRIRSLWHEARIQYIKELLLTCIRELGRRYAVEYAESFRSIGPRTSRAFDVRINIYSCVCAVYPLWRRLGSFPQGPGRRNRWRLFQNQPAITVEMDTTEIIGTAQTTTGDPLCESGGDSSWL